jgi:hypothetical protein
LIIWRAAPGINAPLGSRIIPEMLPPVAAGKGTVARKHKTITRKIRLPSQRIENGVMIISL